MNRPQRKGRWSWKVPDPSANRDLNLLYEPGNWGDILKGSWAAILAARLARQLEADKEWSCVDPFAGAPTYPLVEASRHRLELIPWNAYAGGQAPFLAQGQLGSTASLVREVASLAGSSPRLEVFDLSPERRAKWEAEGGARVLDADRGESVLQAIALPGAWPALLLIDPYDFFDRARELLPLLPPEGAQSATLIYAFNRAPRGGEYLRKDAELKAALRRRRALIGRVPSDAGLARAYHEVYLLGPAALLDELEGELRRETELLAERIVQGGAFESHRP